MPPHKVYAELYCRTAAIYQNKRKTERNILNDIDVKVYEHWQEKPEAFTEFEIYNQDALVFIDCNEPLFNREDTLLYLDPPYPFSSRRCKTDIYRHEMTDDQHRALLGRIQQLKCKVVISSYQNPLYLEALEDWSYFEFTTTTHRGASIESVWFNYPFPAELHDYRYIGKDYRERERIMNVQKRTLSKMQRLPLLERKALLQYLSDNLV